MLLRDKIQGILSETGRNLTDLYWNTGWLWEIKRARETTSGRQIWSLTGKRPFERSRRQESHADICTVEELQLSNWQVLLCSTKHPICLRTLFYTTSTHLSCLSQCWRGFVFYAVCRWCINRDQRRVVYGKTMDVTICETERGSTQEMFDGLIWWPRIRLSVFTLVT